MSLDLSIANALSGIKVVQRSIDTVSQNITNAQTPGYTRKTLDQTAVVIGTTGQGVQAGDLKRVVDASLQADVRRRQSQVSGLEVKETYLQRIEELQGSAESETSLAATFGKLQDSFEKLSSTPESSSQQIQVISDATSLTDQLRSTSTQIQTLRTQAHTDIVSSLGEVNGQLKRIAELNDKIVTETNAGNSTANLEDLRDQALQNLSTYVDIQVVRGSDNRAIVMTRSGMTLVDRSAQQLSLSTAQLDAGSYYSASPPGNIPGLMTSGPPPRDVTSALTGGKIGALIELRDQTLPLMQGQLDTFAQQLAERFQAAGMTLFTDANGGVPSSTSSSAVGFATRIKVNPATTSPDFVRYGDAGDPALQPPGQPGISNQRILNVLNYAMGDYADSGKAPHTAFRTTYLGANPQLNLTSDLPQNVSLGAYIQTLVAEQGQMRADVTADKTQAEDLKSAVETRSSNLSGVNLDTEMASLQILQRSYSASAQVLKTAQTMMDSLFAVVR